MLAKIRRSNGNIILSKGGRFMDITEAEILKLANLVTTKDLARDGWTNLDTVEMAEIECPLCEQRPGLFEDALRRHNETHDNRCDGSGMTIAKAKRLNALKVEAK